AGVYQPAKQIEESKVPVAVASFLEKHTEVRTIALHLDNDYAGRRMAQALKAVLPSRYVIRDRPSPQGKDCNDYLCLKLGRQ
ncbi:toprim domain-containing protein, partial [Anaerovorax odorimutans]